MKRARDRETEEILGPAKRHAFHVAREVRTRAGVRRGWRNIAEHPLTFMYERGQLARGAARATAQDRYDAGNIYRRLCELVARSGLDSTVSLTCRVRAAPIQIGEDKIDALARLAVIDAELKLADRAILRRVCGDGWRPGEAVREALGHAHYAKVSTVRVVEALDALVDALRATRARARSGF